MRYIFSVITLIFSLSAFSQVLLYEDFEPRDGYSGGVLPPKWTVEYEDGFEDWVYQEGGHSFNPDSAANGIYNAMFQVESYDNERTKLIMPEIDLSVASIPKLTFYHVQDIWNWLGAENYDILRVYYKTSFLGNWKLLKAFNNPVEEWTEQVIYIDPSDVSSTFYIAFEGKTGYGHGVCIDSVVVEETGAVQKQVTSFKVEQASTELLATGTTNNPILKIPIRVQGNNGSLTLDKFTLTSLNTDDADISANGVKLWMTETSNFSNPEQLGTGVNFSGGKATINSIAKEIPYGYQYLWVTYDISPTALHGNLFDAQLEAASVEFSNGSFPVTTESPLGNRTIFETVYFQDFEGDMSSWTISSAFEVGTPSGLGGTEGGSPDPAYAVSGVNVLGNGVVASTDEEALYANNIADSAEWAITPTFDLSFYRNTEISFSQWLNVEVWDRAGIYYSIDGNQTWQQLWVNSTSSIDNDWQNKRFDVSDLVDRQSQVSFRFSLGYTSPEVRYSGWNIDNFIIVSNFLEKDVAISSWNGPVSGCGLNSGQHVSITLKNMAGAATSFDIPVAYSLDNGITWIEETITQSIAVGDSLVYEFTEIADFSEPGYYYPIAKVMVPEDEDTGNDRIFGPDIYAVPTLTIPYDEHFDFGDSYWLAEGTNSSWEVGEPAGNSITEAYSGSKAWITSTVNNFLYDDSSTVTSPCFDFSGIEDPVFEFAINETFDKTIAGAGLQYSIDTGKTWIQVPKLEDKWNWYSDAGITILDSEFGLTEGWGTPTNGWKIAKHFLPKDLLDQGLVQFRVAFASEDAGTGLIPTDGFAFDDVKLYNSPPDAGVSAVLGPLSACELSDAELVEVEITNYGIDTINVGDSMIVAYDLDGVQQCVDTFLMATDVLPAESFTYSLSVPVDFSHAGNYDINAYTLVPLDVDFYDDATNNDTTVHAVEVYGMPDYDIGPDFGSEDIPSVVLDAGAGYVNYTWSGGATPPTTQTYDIGTEGQYFVTVENDRGCFANDSITIVYSAKDIEVSDILSPVSACLISVPQPIKIQVVNSHLQTFVAGEKLVFGCRVSDQLSIIDTLTLSADFATDDTITFTFSSAVDLSKVGEYNFSAYSILSEDIDLSNDTVTKLVGHWGDPVIDFGADTIYTLVPDTVVLAVEGSYIDYMWQDGSVEQTFTVTEKSTQTYALTVTADHGCGTDSDQVVISATDISIGSLFAPITSCSLTDSETLMFSVINQGLDTLYTGTNIDLSFILDGGAVVKESIPLDADLNPGSMAVLNSASVIDLSSVETHLLELYVTTHGDVNGFNNSLASQIDVYGYPAVDLGVDTILTYAHIDSLPILDADNGTNNCTYQWNDFTSATTAKLRVLNPQNFMYVVTVSDDNCYSTDTVWVFTDDFSIDNSNADISFCELGPDEQLMTTVKNSSTNLYPIGTEFTLSYQVNDGTIVSEMVQTNSPLASGGTFDYYFAQKADLSTGTDFQITYSVDYATESYKGNNSTQGSAYAIGYPEIDFGYGDTIRSQRPDTVELWLNEEFDTYLWHNGSSQKDVFYIPGPVPGWYGVTVSYDPGCYGSDSVYLDSYDLEITDILSPINNCVPEGNSNVSVRVINSQTSTIPAGDTVFFWYAYADTSAVDTLVLASDLGYFDSFEFTFDDTLVLQQNKNYRLRVGFDYYRDGNAVNSKDSVDFSIFGTPSVDLGPDTIFTTRPDTVLLDAGTEILFYNWNCDSTVQSFYAPFDYSFTYVVSGANANICYATDSLTIITTDLELTEVISPVDSCQLSVANSLEFVVTNTSGNSTPFGDSLYVTCETVDSVIFTEGLRLPIIGPYEKDTIVAKTSFDLSMYDMVDLKVSINYPMDSYQLNDTLIKSLQAWGNPVPQLNADTLFISESETKKVFTAVQYAGYEWSTGALTDTIELSGFDAGFTYLTVTDASGCKGTDSVAILSKDASITILTDPSDCSLGSEVFIQAYLKNEGIEQINTTDTMFVQLKLGDSVLVSDTLALVLNSKDSAIFEFSKPFDFSFDTAFTLQAVFTMDDDVIAGNNSDLQAVLSFGYPEPDFGFDSVFTASPDTLKLKLPQAYTTYEWTGGIDTSVFESVNDESAYYFVTVSNEYACTGYDSLYVFTEDIAITSLLSPSTDCYLNAQENISIEIENNGAAVIPVGTEFYIQTKVNGTEFNIDTVSVEQELPQGEVFEVVISKLLQTEGVTEFVLEFDLLNQYDIVLSNNSLSEMVMNNGYPDFSLGGDLIITGQPDTVIFNLPDGYTYEWNTGSTEASLTAVDASKALYIVTATDGIGCKAQDSVAIIKFNPVFDSITGIHSSCAFTSAEEPSVLVENAGFGPILPSDSVFISVYVDHVLQAEVQLSDTIAIGEIIPTATATIDMSALGVYLLEYKTIVKFSEGQSVVNTVTETVNHYGYPLTSIAEDTITQQLPISLELDKGYTYNWSTGETGDAISVQSSGWVLVTVTNQFDCAVYDSVLIYGYDLSLDSVIFPLGTIACTEDVSDYPKLRVKNKGVDTLRPGMELSFILNAQTVTQELKTIVLPGASVDIKPDFSVDSDLGLYSLSAVLSVEGDISPANNAEVLDYEMKQSPIYKLYGGADTVKGSAPFTIRGSEEYDLLWSTAETSVSITVNKTGWYSLTVFDEIGCPFTDSVFLNLSGTGINGISSNIEVVPVPFRDNLMVSAEKAIDRVVMSSAIGQKVYDDKLPAGSRSIHIQTDELVQGTYILLLLFEDGSKAYKVVNKE